MRRKTFDLLAVIGGLVLAVVLAVAGGLLLWGHNFVSDQVHTQLAAQKIVFPPAGSPIDLPIGCFGVPRYWVLHGSDFGA